jgi:hypothetical protein
VSELTSKLSETRDKLTLESEAHRATRGQLDKTVKIVENLNIRVDNNEELVRKNFCETVKILFKVIYETVLFHFKNNK